MPLITLTSDIGQKDHLLGAIRGQLLQSIPGIQLVDISHELSHWNFLNATYVCSNTMPWFAPGTIHIVLVSVFETSHCEIVLAKHKDQYLICPNNGLATMIFQELPQEYTVIELQPLNSGSWNLLGYTQKMAGLIQLMLQKQLLLKPDPEGRPLIEKYPMKPAFGSDWMDGQIVYIDQFENVVVNISREEFEQQRNGRRYQIEFARNSITLISNNYASVKPGELVAWFNSSGLLEIAQNKGNIAGIIGLQGYGSGTANDLSKPSFFYSTVRIYFIDPAPAESPERI